MLPHRFVFAAVILSAGFGNSGRALSFIDSFDTSASALWRNEVGSWSVSGGAYRANAPSNNPNASSSLGLAVLTDFTIELDLINPADGGLWLRSTVATGTAVGRTGVLLVSSNGNLYWHSVTDGNAYGSALNLASGAYTQGSSLEHLKVVVSGNQYSAYLNGASSPISSLTDANFASGDIAVYANSSQQFDNVSILTAVPEPQSVSIASAFLLGVFGMLTRFRRVNSGE